jgi:hypothetical protein
MGQLEELLHRIKRGGEFAGADLTRKECVVIDAELAELRRYKAAAEKLERMRSALVPCVDAGWAVLGEEPGGETILAAIEAAKEE